MSRSEPLGDELRRTLAALGDVLVPQAEGMPSASEVGIEGRWVDRVLRARPDLEPILVRLLGEAEARDPVEEVDRLNAQDPDSFATLALVVTGAYYMHPRVRKLIGYPGQKRNPPAPDEAEYYLRDGILDSVSERGAIYRPTPA
jgi:hypothetical protein